MRSPLATRYRVRARRIGSIRSALERDHYPRLQMLLIVMLTGVSGWLASFLMLGAGVLSMGPRYFYAMCAAYIAFLLLLWIWLRVRGDQIDGAADFGGGQQYAPQAPSCEGQGGSFDGGGASADYGDAASALDVVDGLADLAPSAGDGGSVVGESLEALGSAADAGEAGGIVVIVAVAVLAVTIVFSSLFVVYTAPVLLSELLVDGVLAASLYRRLKGLDRRHWLETALRRTMWPFIGTALVVTACGWAMERYAPEAHSLGQVLQHHAPEGK